jgi:hypothetical protein
MAKRIAMSRSGNIVMVPSKGNAIGFAGAPPSECLGPLQISGSGNSDINNVFNYYAFGPDPDRGVWERLAFFYSVEYNPTLTRWEIKEFSTVLYYNDSDAFVPPSVGWQVENGASPAPTSVVCLD